MSASDRQAREPKLAIGSAMVWPPGQVIGSPDEPVVKITDFGDWRNYHAELAEQILTLSRSNRARNDGERQGLKIHHIPEWDSDVATLVEERARALACRAQNLREASIDLGWATVYRTGEFAHPHAHIRAFASLVYCVDPGDPLDEQGEPAGGKFSIIDPRIKACCPLEPGHPTKPLSINMVPGRMVMFPGAVLHFVTPYRGNKPRITMAWNINPKALPGEPLPKRA
jgi:hypothetical protein